MEKQPTLRYQNLGGINLKASEYTVGLAQFLNLRNVDFNVPNALQKRPGSTQMAIGLSSPVTSIYEYTKLDGASYIVAGDFYGLQQKTGTSFTKLIGTGSSNAPFDHETFNNTLFSVNGMTGARWQGTSMTQMGLPIAGVTLANDYDSGSSVGVISVFGVTSIPPGASTLGERAIAYAAYRFVRDDGYYGPMVLANHSRPISPYVYTGAGTGGWQGNGAGNYGVGITMGVYGISTPDVTGITAIALYVALDNWIYARDAEIGKKGSGDFIMTDIIKDSADPTLFRFFTMLPVGTTFTGIVGSNNGWTNIDANNSFSGMAFDYYATYTPRFIELNQNRMFYSGFTIAPSQVFYAEVGEPESILPDSFFETRTNDGDEIRAQKSFQDQMHFFKRKSFHKLIGDSPDNFELVEVTQEYGCLSNNAIVEHDNKLLFLDDNGVVEYNGASWNIISTPVEDIFRRMNVSAALNKAVAVHAKLRNQIWFGIPIDGATQNNITVVYDYLINAWTFFDGFNAASFARVQGGLSNKPVWYGDYGGKIHYFSPSFYGDNGTGITCLIKTRWENPNGEDTTNMYRRLFLDVNTVSGITGVINTKVFADYDDSTVKATFAIYQNQFQSRADFGVPGKSVQFEMSHNSASLPFLLNGYGAHSRFLRKV